MKIILTRDVAGLGSKGETKEVKDGYALNFLLPRGLAKLLTLSTLKELDEANRQQIKKEEKSRKDSLAIKAQFENRTVIIRKKAKNGKLFGSVGRRDLCQLVKELIKIKLEEAQVVLDEPLKFLGEFPFKVILPGQIELNLKVLIEAE